MKSVPQRKRGYGKPVNQHRHRLPRGNLPSIQPH
jgi:hypothetical protein